MLQQRFQVLFDDATSDEIKKIQQHLPNGLGLVPVLDRSIQMLDFIAIQERAGYEFGRFNSNTEAFDQLKIIKTTKEPTKESVVPRTYENHLALLLDGPTGDLIESLRLHYDFSDIGEVFEKALDVFSWLCEQERKSYEVGYFDPKTNKFTQCFIDY